MMSHRSADALVRQSRVGCSDHVSTSALTATRGRGRPRSYLGLGRLHRLKTKSVRPPFGAAPWPRLHRLDESRFDRVILDVMNGLVEVRIIADVTVEVVILPPLA